MQIVAINNNITIYKVVVSMLFGLLGFAVNFYPVDFVFYGAYRMSFLLGLLFPMLITLSWGWKYGLLSALCGGCQTMWILWLPQSGAGPLVSVPPFTLWIVWLGWFSRTKHNIYLGEIIFRIFNTALLYTVFRWVFSINLPPHNVGIPLEVVHSIVFKELINGVLILFIAQALLYLGKVRTFFGVPKVNENPRLYYIYVNIIIISVILTLGFVAEKYVWGMWGLEFQNVGRVIGSLFLLLIGITFSYFAGDAFAKKKTDELILAGEALQESESGFRKILERVPVAIAILDKNNNTEYANNKYLETIGYDAHVNLSDWFLLAYPNGEYRRLVIEKWNADVKKALREESEVRPSEYNVTCKDGKVRTMEISATFVANKMITIFVDVTERKEIENIMAKREEKFRLLTENSMDCIWTMDKRLRFTYLSPYSLERIMGVKVKDWIGTKLRSHFSKKEFLKVSTLIVKIIKNYKNFSCVVLETKMFDGKRREIDMEISSRPLLDKHGGLIGLQGVARDITERKQAEEELAKYRDHLKKLVKKRTEELEEKNKELERFNRLFINRELRIKEIKDKVKKLEKK